MNGQFKISRAFLEAVKADLIRPHEVAFERVGFLFGIQFKNLIIGHEYEPIGDQLYIEDSKVGARFSGGVIKEVLERSLRTGQSAFHTHIHEHDGEPFLSMVDVRSVVEISKSLKAINPGADHGCLILSNDQAKAYILTPDGQLAPVLTSVIGFPISQFNKEKVYER